MMPPVLNQKIREPASFEAVTGEFHEVAGLYFYMVTDCLVDLAYKVSCDFFKRPHFYTNLGQAQPSDAVPNDTNNSLPRILAELHARYGSDEFFPSKQQRDEIFVPIFGRSAGQVTSEGSDFPHLRDELMNAATAFVKRAVDTGVEMLRESVRDAHQSFHDYLVQLQGDSVKWSRQFALARLTEDVSYTILRNKGVASVFGFATPPGVNWPYVEDSNGDTLVEAISNQPMLDKNPDEVYVTRGNFSGLQRTALRGAEAISSIIELKNPQEDELDLLITRVYTWGSALSGSTSSLGSTPLSSTAKEDRTSSSGSWKYNSTKK